MMEIDDINNSGGCANANTSDVGVDCQSAVNSLILNYYKKFGKKRDLEQYFSLSTAPGDIKNPSGVFWRKMKSENDSSESEGKKSDSSQEVCRISIKCSVPEHSSSQDENTQTKTESESPPIITEDIAVDVSRHTEEESIKSDDNNSQNSYDVLLDTSVKPLSPTSSVTSQRKLEWDSLADVGYANESDRKTSASSLSTLERLALIQQYANNDTKQDIGPPTSHSTPLDENDNKGKLKKALGKKTTKFYKKDIDFVEVNVPHSDTNPSQSINVNLTKHISFNVEKGRVTVDSIQKDVSVSPEKSSTENVTPYISMDKEIQTSLTKTKDKSTNPVESPKPRAQELQKIPVMISLNTLKKRIRRKKVKPVRRTLRPRKKVSTDKDVVLQEKSEQLSEAESFEYMPGHIYNQNLKSNDTRHANTSGGNKSSLESSGGITDSSKDSKHSFTKDLEKSIELLKVTLQKRYDDSDIKNKLIKEVVSRLLNSRYRDDDSSAEFLSGPTFSSRKLDIRDSQTTTSSDANNTADKKPRPRKSILRVDKFNSNVVASTSQSAPNLLSIVGSDKASVSNLAKVTLTSDSGASSKGRTSSDNAFPKTSSEELYLKYLEALRREEAYKKHLKDKERFLKHKLASTDTVFKVPVRQDATVDRRLKNLMKDLTRNNYDDGSGDASKLEGVSSSVDLEKFGAIRNSVPRSHSVFTLSSSPSECQGKKPNLKKNQCDGRGLTGAGPSKYPDHYCCCPQHYVKSKVGYTDSSVQVNIKCQYEDAGSVEPKLNECHKCRESSKGMSHVISNDAGDIKYVCLCNEPHVTAREMGNNFLIYKCSRLTNRGVQIETSASKTSNTGIQCGDDTNRHLREDINFVRPPCKLPDNESSSSDNISCRRKQSKSSQTNLNLNMLYSESSGVTFSDGKTSKGNPYTSTKCVSSSEFSPKNLVHEATRCLQTEISINPKISDPSLTDINLVNDCECAKLIDEKYREVSKTYSKKSSCQTKDCISDFGKNSPKDEINKCSDDFNKFGQIHAGAQEKDKNVNDDYTIPIQGTNMTLRVSTLGSAKEDENVEKVDQGCVTDKAPIVDQATSIRDECSKSVQCEDTNTATIKNTVNSYTVDYNSNKVNKEISTQNESYTKQHPEILGIVEKSKGNTYPKNIKKLLLRTNTDTDKLDDNYNVQTEFPFKRDCGTQPVPYNDENTRRTTKTYKNYNDYISKPENNVVDHIVNNNNRLSESESNVQQLSLKKDIGVQKNQPTSLENEIRPVSPQRLSKHVGCEIDVENLLQNESVCTPESRKKKIQVKSGIVQRDSQIKKSDLDRNENDYCVHSKGTSSSEAQNNLSCHDTGGDTIKDPIMDMIKDITRRYSKTDLDKIKKRRGFKEIMTVLNYFLETDERDTEKPSSSSYTDTKSSSEKQKSPEKVPHERGGSKKTDKTAQLTSSCKIIKVSTESFEIPASSDLPASSDSATCKVLNKIKKECEKYHQKRCKAGKKCEASSSTSVNCDQCKKTHHCYCKSHKCKRSKTNAEKYQKKCVAYNLIIQTSESMLSEETTCDRKGRPLQNIVVKVPKRKPVENICKETSCKKETVYKVEKPRCSPRYNSNCRSRSCPNDSEISSTEELLKRTQQCTVREYLEKNRPDFVESAAQRQNCLKFVKNIRANERSAKRDLLSLHVARQPDLTSLSADQLRRLANDIGLDLRRRKPAPKFISEKEMKKHSEKIYKTLPEVVQKKEEQKKENYKKTNLLMANIFKKIKLSNGRSQ